MSTLWITLAIASSILLGLYDVAKKHALRDNAVIPVLFTATLIGSLPFAALLLSNGMFSVRLAPLPVFAHFQLFLKAILVGSSWVLAFFSLKHLPISIVAPIRSSSPAWTLLGALLLFGERLSPMQWLGVGAVLSSYMILAWNGKREQIHFLRNRWVGLAVGATFLGALSALYDKYLLLRYPPLEMQCWFYVYLVVVLGTVLLCLWFPRRATLTAFRWTPSIIGIGLLLAASDFLYFHAVSQPGALISLISVVRRSSVVIAFLVGAFAFQEKHKRGKAIAVAGILCGIVLIALARGM